MAIFSTETSQIGKQLDFLAPSVVWALDWCQEYLMDRMSFVLVRYQFKTSFVSFLGRNCW